PVFRARNDATACSRASLWGIAEALKSLIRGLALSIPDASPFYPDGFFHGRPEALFPRELPRGPLTDFYCKPSKTGVVDQLLGENHVGVGGLLAKCQAEQRIVLHSEHSFASLLDFVGDITQAWINEH